jgi:adenylate cyclase
MLLGLLLSVAFGTLGQMQTGLPLKLNNLFLDFCLKQTATGKLAKGVVVIDIDDVSLSAVGQWPWPRYRIATLVQAVAAAKPLSIGLDIIFPEYDRTSPDNIQKSFKQDFGLDIAFINLPPALRDNDGYFGRILRDTDVVGSRYFYFDHVNKDLAPSRPEFQITGRTDLLSLNNASGILNNTEAIASQLKFSGFLNSQPDSDGLLRRLPLLIRHNGHIYPHLSLATFMRSLGIDHATIEKDRYGPVIHVGRHFIPINENGYTLIRFNGAPDLYPAIPALEVLNGTFDHAAVEGKVVFIGTSAAGLNDLHATLFDLNFPGLSTQAAIVDNMQTDNFVREFPWAGSAIFLSCIIAGLSLSVLFVRLRHPVSLLLGSAAIIGVLFAMSFDLFRSARLFVSPAAPIMLTVVLYALFTTAKYAIEKQHAYVWFKKLANAHQVTMESMAAIAETRDPETGAHIKRTQHYVKAIAERLRETGKYHDILSEEFIDLLFVSAPLHDIGKVGVPDNILLKPGKLTPEEFEIMKQHAKYGKDIIHSTAQKIEGDNFLLIAGEIASTHHEKWDGTGYPEGLAGENIPLSGRIMAVADVYDALISRRCYKPPFTHEHSMSLMKASRGTIFDPVVFDAFLSIEPAIRRIAATYQDPNEVVLGDR